MSNTTADKLSYLIETKNAIKQAIISMGVPVGDDVTFREYADKIREISTDATATAYDIINDKTAYAGGEMITGTYVVTEAQIPEVGGTINEANDLAEQIIGENVEEV